MFTAIFVAVEPGSKPPIQDCFPIPALAFLAAPSGGHTTARSLSVNGHQLQTYKPPKPHTIAFHVQQYDVKSSLSLPSNVISTVPYSRK
jgi:hypothetical protein